MTLEEYIGLLESPQSVDAEHIQDLESLLSYAPYCQSARLLLQKAYFRTRNTRYISALPLAALSAREPRDLYFLLHPKKIVRQAVTSNDYFSFIERMQQEADKNGESFEELAKRFVAARAGIK